MKTSRSDRSWDNGFIAGFLSAIILIGAFVYGQHAAYGSQKKNPPAYWVNTALKIGACEQPSGRSGKWNAVNWTNKKNHSFEGGMGMTNVLWDEFKRPGQPDSMADAKPMEQIAAAWRFYNWAEKTYPGYGYTGWGCSEIIGFRGFNPDGTWK